MIRMPWSNVSRAGQDSAGPLVFAIGQALQRVREGSTDDESHALAANKIVRRCLDKHAITYQEYKHWRKLNPLIFTTIVDESNQLIGFFDIFPLKNSAGEAIIAGRLTERSLSTDHLVASAEAMAPNYLHIATIVLNPRQRTFIPVVAKEVLLLKMSQFLERHYAPMETRTYTAFAQSRAGEALLKRCGFSLTLLAKDNDQGFPLYVLRPSETGKAIFRFERADNFFSRKATLRGLDARIEEIELQLRVVITKILNDDAGNLPSHVNQKIDERLRSEAHKNAAFDLAYYRRLPAKLEFCDLRELQEIIVSKPLWPKFQEHFVNKETLIAKFGQLADLRNAVRHSRSVDEIIQIEGQAGIMWFERVLRR
jgi:hypothetical protein